MASTCGGTAWTHAAALPASARGGSGAGGLTAAGGFRRPPHPALVKRWPQGTSGRIDPHDGRSCAGQRLPPAGAVQALPTPSANRSPAPTTSCPTGLGQRAALCWFLIDRQGECHARRMPACCCARAYGWRIGPLLADSPALATPAAACLARHPGVVLIDVPRRQPPWGPS